MSGHSIRAIVCGGGNAGKAIIRSLHSHRIGVVGALEITNIGVDVGVHAGIDPVDVAFEKDARALLERASADVAMITIGSPITSIFDLAKMALEHGTNVITIAEDAYYPWTEEDLALAAELDAVARAHGVTLIATGMQDIYWQNCAAMFSTVTDHIQAIRLVTTAIQDGNSRDILDTIYAGHTLEQFEANPVGEIKEVSRGPLYALAKDLGLTPTEGGVRVEPIVTEADHYSALSDLLVPAGHIIGTRELTTMHTAEGTALVAEFRAKLADDGETDGFQLVIDGAPGIRVTVEGMDGFANTANIAVNRILDVLAAPPGYLTVGDLPRPSFKAQPKRGGDRSDQ